MPDLPTMTRRDVVRLTLTVGATTALLGCTRQSDGQPGPTSPGGPEDPDRALRAEVGRAEAALITLYAEVARGLGGSDAVEVAALGVRHEAYRQAIDPDRLADLPASGSPTPSTSSGSASPSSSATPPAKPTTAKAAAARLRSAETEAARARIGQAGRATDAELARVIVLAGAGAASAAEVLRGGTP